MKYNILHRVTVPSISMKESGEYLFRVEGLIVDKPDRDSPDKLLHIMRVTDLCTDQMGDAVLGKVLYETFVERYPEGAAIGKCFRILKKPSGKAGKGGMNEYNLFYVEEIEITAEGELESASVKLPL